MGLIKEQLGLIKFWVTSEVLEIRAGSDYVTRQGWLKD